MGDLVKGPVRLTGRGAASVPGLEAVQEIIFGHKIALRDIDCGEPIVKYGAVIGEAVRSIKKGTHVHLHNIKSRYDERSSTYDPVTAETTDMEYKTY
jgi:hypothetical protein